jgi:hypothetical protein
MNNRVLLAIVLMFFGCAEKSEIVHHVSPLVEGGRDIDNFIIRAKDIEKLKSSIAHHSIGELAQTLAKNKGDPVCVPWLVSISNEGGDALIRISVFKFHSKTKILEIKLEDEALTVENANRIQSATEDRYFQEIGGFSELVIRTKWEELVADFSDGLKIEIGKTKDMMVTFKVSKKWEELVRSLENDPGFILDIPLPKTALDD